MADRHEPGGIPTEQSLRALASMDAGDAAVVSFYLDTDGRRSPRRSDLERATADALRAVESQDLSRAARASVTADCARIREYVAKEFQRNSTRGLAVFASDAIDLWNVCHLPAPVRTRAVADRHPHVLRLEALVSRAERFATVLISRDKARLFTTFLGHTEERSGVLDDVPGKHGQGGWSQANYSRHIDEIAHRHSKHAAEVLFELSRKEPFDRLILAGPEEAAGTFEKDLHPWLAERVAGRISLPMTAGIARVAEAVREAEDRIEDERAAEAVARILEEFAAGRSAVVGLGKTLAALGEGRVETLAIADGEPRAGYRCDVCARLAATDGACGACGGAMLGVADLNEEIVDEALRKRCGVVAAQTRPLPDGIGALLRF
ncbi:MAG TPA: Vms1/Ankzf1 family peptidyl-tRNA hydrolase [Actinomycetota bacterium]|nr:Vms1/Ankzf1 family peptidyl-tRNA hydrolase [Actinomycetota bacterium]